MLTTCYPGLRSCAAQTLTRWKLFKILILLCVAGFVYIYLTVSPYSVHRIIFDPGTNQELSKARQADSPGVNLVATSSLKIDPNTPSITQTQINGNSLPPAPNPPTTGSPVRLSGISSSVYVPDKSSLVTKTSVPESTTVIPAASTGDIPGKHSVTQLSTVTLTSTKSPVPEELSSNTSSIKSVTESFTKYVNNSSTPLSSISSPPGSVSVSLSANTPSTPGLSTVPTQTTLKPAASTTAATGQSSPLYITSLFTGRLGNQMFIYSALIGIARAGNRTAFIKRGTDLEATFQITHLNDSINATGWENVGEASYATFDTKFMTLTPTNKTISGYFQTWRYFNHCQDEVRREFRFKDEISRKALEHLQKFKRETGNSLIIGVHVRRGDYLTDYNVKLGYGVAPASYFLNAFRKIRELFPGKNCTFLVASDDLRWCKESLRDPDVRIMPDDSPMVHFAVLANCDHVILSGGTYGWWAAWLSPGVKIYYSRFIVNGTWLSQGFTRGDYYPPDWIGLDN